MSDINNKHDKLLPCPFCGGEGILQESEFMCLPVWSIACLNCQTYCDEYDAKEKAIKAWNTRKEME